MLCAAIMLTIVYLVFVELFISVGFDISNYTHYSIHVDKIYKMRNNSI